MHTLRRTYIVADDLIDGHQSRKMSANRLLSMSQRPAMHFASQLIGIRKTIMATQVDKS